MLAPDGAYTFVHGQARFHRASAPITVRTRTPARDPHPTHHPHPGGRSRHPASRGILTSLYIRTGVLIEDPEYPWLDLYPDSGGDHALEQLASAAVRYRIAVGPIVGRKTMTLHSPGTVSDQCTRLRL